MGNGLLWEKSKEGERASGGQGSCSIKGLAVAAAFGALHCFHFRADLTLPR
jgi:hypothetical protein